MAFLIFLLSRTHKRKEGLDRIILDFDLEYVGDNDLQASIVNIPVGVK